MQGDIFFQTMDGKRISAREHRARLMYRKHRARLMYRKHRAQAKIKNAVLIAFIAVVFITLYAMTSSLDYQIMAMPN